MCLRQQAERQGRDSDRSRGQYKLRDMAVTGGRQGEADCDREKKP